MPGLSNAIPTRPSALEQREAIKQALADRSVVLFSDYDGTLTPIVARPELAILDEAVRNTLGGLATRCPVGVISGRAMVDIRQLVALDSLYYAGNHGLEVIGPQGSGIQARRGEEYFSELEQARDRLQQQLADINGVLVEDKQFSLSIHYRLAPDDAVAAIEQQVDDIARHSRLRKHHGKKVFELRPDMDWHKGHVLNWLLELMSVPNALPIYLGDDVTDEDAFQAVAETGIGIRIGDPAQESRARYNLDDCAEVGAFLNWLLQLLEEG